MTSISIKYLLVVALSLAAAAGLVAQPTLSVIPAPQDRQIGSMTLSRNGDWIGMISTAQGTTPQLHRLDTTHLQRTDLGLIGGSNAVVRRNGISNDGQKVAFSHTLSSPGQTLTQAYRWHNGTLVRVKAGLYNSTAALPTDMSADGNRIFGIGHGFMPQREAWVWTENGTTSIIPSTPLPGPDIYEVACAADGQVAVWTPVSGSTSYLWTGGSAAMPVQNGVRWTAISADGSQLAGASTSRELFVWNHQSGQPQSLGQIAQSEAVMVQHLVAHGNLIIGSRFGEMWAWTPSNGIVSLFDYFTDVGIDMTGWSGLGVTSVSDDGRVFAGIGHHQGAFNTRFVVVIPASSTAVPLAIAGLVVIRRRRR